MKSVLRLCAAWSALAFLVMGSSAYAVKMKTVDWNPSDLTISVSLYDAENDEFTEVGTSGPLNVEGQANIETFLDEPNPNAPWAVGPGDGEFAFINSLFKVANATFLVDLGLGPGLELTVDLSNVGMQVVTSGGSNGGAGIPVLNNVWDLDSGAPDTMDMNLNAGKLIISGAILDLLGADNPSILNLNSDPVGVELADILGNGVNGLADEVSVQMNIPLISIDVGADLLGPGLLFAQITGNINIIVPEPGSIAMAGVGLVGLVVLGRRRFRKNA